MLSGFDRADLEWILAALDRNIMPLSKLHTWGVVTRLRIGGKTKDDVIRCIRQVLRTGEPVGASDQPGQLSLFSMEGASHHG
ncbi:MAG: hypothetical protein KGL63_14655 [Betaproteobacteria bacterium]|nr:hypothetical protein [Betaproteobacteria bacterium]